MHKIVQVAGVIIFLVGGLIALAGIAVAASAPRFGAETTLVFLVWSGSVLVAGAVLYCFGTIVERLTEIRNLLSRDARP